MLGVSAVLHTVLLGVVRMPAGQAPRIVAFEPIEVSLLAAESTAWPAHASPTPRVVRVPFPTAEPPPPSAAAADHGAVASGPPTAAEEPNVESATAPSRSRPGTRLDPIVEARADVAALSNPKPSYPLAARRRGVEGRVLLSAHVHADGACAEVRLKRSSGHALLDQAALDAVRRWRFLPARRAGAPIDSWVDVPVSFRLDG
jgi:protein TonB